MAADRVPTAEESRQETQRLDAQRERQGYWSMTEDEGPIAWLEPTPLDGSHRLPAFPVHVLPTWCANFIDALATSTQTPTDFGGMFCIASLSAAAGGRLVVDVQPDWTEPTNLYVVVASPPGTLKSAVVKRLARPIEDYEEMIATASTLQIVEAETLKKLLDQRAKDAEREAAKAEEGTEAEDALAKALKARMDSEIADVPPRPRILADDLTAEALGSILTAQGGRSAVFSAEGGLFDVLAGRYSKLPNFDMFLKAWSGDTIRVDRSSRGPEFVKDPALTMALAVQPDVIRTIATHPGCRGRGLLARFLYAMPINNVGHRNVRDPEGVSVQIANAYEREMQLLLSDLYPSETWRRLTVSAAAREVLVKYREKLEPRLRPGADLAHVADWASKLHGQLVRCAALIHIASTRGSEDREITADTMAGAAVLADYLLAHALQVFDYMGADPAVAGARHVLGWIKEQNKTQFTKRDAHHDNQGTFHRVADLEPALALLVERSWIRPAPKADRKPGRPSEIYDVNPVSWTEHTEPTKPKVKDPQPGSVCSVVSVQETVDEIGFGTCVECDTRPGAHLNGRNQSWCDPCWDAAITPLPCAVCGDPANRVSRDGQPRHADCEETT